MRNVLIIGATSAIAEATARRLAVRGERLYLLARDRERLAAVAADLKVRGAAAVWHEAFEAERFESHPALLDAAAEAMGGIDLALIAHGTLPDQTACEAHFEATLEALNVNLLGTLSLLTHLANRLAAQGRGTLAVIGSVAGDRGRRSNYVYGTAKGALAIFLQGLRNRLAERGVQVLTIKPGFVDTPMTEAFAKGPLWASPERIAAGIERAVERGRDVAYLPPFWRLVMWVIRTIPERIFKRMNL